MPRTQKIAQRKWLRGVNAAAQAYAQPPGSFPRASNLIFSRRGALITCDGSQMISVLNGSVSPPFANIGPITEVVLYGPQGGPYNYFAIAKDFLTNIPAPSGLAAAAGAAGVLNGIYHYVITALDGAGGETTVSNEVTVTLGLQQAVLTWTPVPLAAGGYNIYRTVAGGGFGTEKFVATVPGQATSTYTDNLPDGSLGANSPPVLNNTQVSQFYFVPAPSFGAANIVKTFPADNLPILPGPPGGGGGGHPPPGGGGQQGPQPLGGVSGNISPLPQIVQFRNLMILLLGNGFPPYSSDGTTPNTIALVNNFIASYGSRAASTPQNVGDQIAVNVAGTNYIFTCVQAGTTAAGGGPTFPAGLNAVVNDGTVYWKNTGAIAASTAPRGAAHGIIYAGSLWIANTTPLTTSDNLDGPSCLKMSDLNNPNSWNPLNVAFLDRDDGTQIQGLATFTLSESGIPPTGSLVVFKDFTTFQVNGVFGASNFSIQKAQTDLGCVSPRTIQFVPGYGIVRMSHLGFAMFDGVRDRVLSEEIRPFLFGGQSDITPLDWNFVWFSKGAQTATPPTYVCACPIQQFLTGSIPFPAPGISVTATAGFLPSATYFLIIQKVYSDNKIFQVNHEYSVGPTTGVLITLPDDGTRNYVWRIFYGTTSNAENRFILTSAGSTSFLLTTNANTQAGTVGSSLGQLTRIFSYDLIMKAWTIIDLPFPISVLHQFRAGGTYPITVMAGFSDGGIRRWNAGAGVDTTWDAGAVNNFAADNIVKWSVRTPEVFGRNASDRTYFRELAIRGFGGPTGIKVQVNFNGISAALALTRNVSLLPMGGNEFVGYLDLGATAIDAYATIQGGGPIEIDSVDWLAVSKQLRGKVSV